MLHAYCVRRAGEPGPGADLGGVNGARVDLLEEGVLGLWISDIASTTVTADRLREHDRVVSAALRTATPLPIRFGAGQFPSEAAARQALGERAGEFMDSLDRVRGQVEMGVRVDWEPPLAPQAPEPRARPESGRAYLQARREALRSEEALRGAADSALDLVERAVGLEGLPSTRTLLPQPGTAGILAHLVRRDGVRAYIAAVAAARVGNEGLRIAHSGPWAPYSFS